VANSCDNDARVQLYQASDPSRAVSRSTYPAGAADLRFRRSSISFIPLQQALTLARVFQIQAEELMYDRRIDTAEKGTFGEVGHFGCFKTGYTQW